jgi:transcriptional regulator with XRE-family HTH domain
MTEGSERGTERGVAYPFWLRVQSERVARGWTTLELETHSGIPRETVSRMPKGKRAPQPRTVNALADTLDIDRDEAHKLAGLVPGGGPAPTSSVREAMLTDPNYTEEQRRTMLAFLDVIEQAHREQTGES